MSAASLGKHWETKGKQTDFSGQFVDSAVEIQPRISKRFSTARAAQPEKPSKLAKSTLAARLKQPIPTTMDDLCVSSRR